MAIQIGFFNTFTPEYTLQEACALGKELGYAGIQPRITQAAPFDPDKPLNPWGNNKGTVQEDDFIRDPKEALKPIFESGLAITSYASYCGLSDPDRAAKLIRACGEVGITAMRLGPMPIPGDDALIDIDGLIAESRSRYKKMLDVSRPAGVKLCVELHMGALTHSPSAAMRILDGFDPADIGILYDPGNMVYEGHEPPRVSISTMGAYLAEVHVKNSGWMYDPGKPAGHRYACKPADLDDGVLDWKDIIDTLKRAGFSGWLIEEAHNEGVPFRERLKKNIEILNACM